MPKSIDKGSRHIQLDSVATLARFSVRTQPESLQTRAPKLRDRRYREPPAAKECGAEFHCSAGKSSLQPKATITSRASQDANFRFTGDSEIETRYFFSGPYVGR